MAGGRVADQIGRVFGGRYRLVAPVGTGGSAHVYVADDTTLRRRVAVKVLQPGLALDQAFLRRFRAEAQAAAALNHPNIMRVFDWGEDDEGPFLVLEFLGGGSLRDMLDSGRRLSISQTVLIGLEAARALDYAHRRGLVHRDLKPANICFDEEGRTAIADFGLARALAEAAWTEPDGVLLGTARYAAPEAAQGKAVDGKADVYALGLVLLEAVTGDPPPVGDTTVATLMARANQPIVAPFGLGALGPIVDAMGLLDPDDRPDAAEVAVMLDTAARQLDAPAPLPVNTVLNLDARAPSIADPTEMGVTTAIPIPNGATEVVPPVIVAGRKTRRRVSMVIAALVAVAAIVAASLYVPTILKPFHEVPNVEGMERIAANQTLGNFKYNAREHSEFSRSIREGLVIKQEPDVGARRREDTTVHVWVSKGQPYTNLPDLSKLPQDEAAKQLEDHHLKLQGIEERFSEDVAEGLVVDWNPKGKIREQSAVRLAISKGAPPRDISNWKGKPFEEAREAIESVGLKVRRVDGYSDEVGVEQVISTSPGPGSTAPRGSTVTVTVSVGPMTITVPNLSGKTVGQARAALQGVGLKVGDVKGPGKGDERHVYDSDPFPGTKVQRGSAVTLYVTRN